MPNKRVRGNLVVAGRNEGAQSVANMHQQIIS